MRRTWKICVAKPLGALPPYAGVTPFQHRLHVVGGRRESRPQHTCLPVGVQPKTEGGGWMGEGCGRGARTTWTDSRESRRRHGSPRGQRESVSVTQRFCNTEHASAPWNTQKRHT